MSAVEAAPAPVPRLRAWLLAARPKTLSAAFAPVLVGGALAARDGLLDLPSVLLAALGAGAIQIATNLHNDYEDFRRGTDDAARVGPRRAAQMGWLTVDDLRRGTLLAAAVAVLAGAALVLRGGWPIAVAGVASLVAGWSYTGGPRPLAYLGVADAFVLAFFGVVAVTGTYWVSALRWSGDALLAGVAVGLLATGILVVNNLRDRTGDARNGKRTLAVRFGAGFARAEYTACVLGAFAIFAGLAASDPRLWLTFAGLPVGALAIRGVARAEGGALNPWLGRTAALLALESLLFAAGLAWL